jgi:hypothetical protein
MTHWISRAISANEKMNALECVAANGNRIVVVLTDEEIASLDGMK